MKVFVIHLCLIALLLSGACLIRPVFAQGNADAKTRTAVIEALNRFNTAYMQRNADQVLALFTPDAFMYGTGADEKRMGTAEIKTRRRLAHDPADEWIGEKGPHLVQYRTDRFFTKGVCPPVIGI